jgi:hypothetical protein
LAAPVAAFRYPPMGDLPFHESLVALLRHFGDETMLPPGVYVRSFGAPNQLFHGLAWLLSLAVPTDVACKLVIAAAIFATPLGAARLARHLGKTAWAALLVAPLALGFAFRWGLVGNVVALPLLLFSLPWLDAYAKSPSWRTAAGSIAVVALAYLAHESAVVIVALASGVFALRRPRNARRIAQRMIPVFACAGLAASYAVWSRHLKAPSILAIPDALGPVAARVWTIPEVLLGSRERVPAYFVFGLYALSAAVFAGPRVVAAARERDPFAAVAAGCLLLYFVFPLALGGSTVLYQRFLPVACALSFVALAPPEGSRLGAAAYVLAIAMPTAGLAMVLPSFVDAERRFADLDALLPCIEKNSAVAQLDLTPRRPSVVAPIPGAPARALAERGGRLLFSFTDAPTSPVVMAPGHQWNEPVLRMTHDPAAFVPAHDFHRFRYALVRQASEARDLRRMLVGAMAPEGRLVAESGEWLLFESALPVVPLTSPDAPLPVPPPPSLGDRFRAAWHRCGSADAPCPPQR